MTTPKLLPAFLIACGFLLTSCSGSESVAGIGGTGITTTGTITGFGSIFVNGIEFETDTASSITVDHVDFDDESGLAVGMVVTVTGTVNDDGLTGTADTIFYDDEIEGPVNALVRDVNTGVMTFTILGQEVSATDDPLETVFDDTTYSDLADDDFVEVSGFIDNSVSPAVIRATRIEKKGDSSNTDTVDIEGEVSNLNTSNKTFTIGSVNIVYDTDTVFEDMTEADLLDTLLVEVRGTYDAVNNLISADFIKSEDESDSEPEEGSKLDIQGIVTDFISISSFVVLGQQVDATDAKFEPESLEGSIENGLLVEVEGTIDNGILFATEVEEK